MTDASNDPGKVEFEVGGKSGAYQPNVFGGRSNNWRHRYALRHHVTESNMTAAATIPVNLSFADRLSGLDRGQMLRLALGVALFVAIGIVSSVLCDL